MHAGLQALLLNPCVSLNDVANAARSYLGV